MKFRLTSEYGEMSLVRDHVHHGIDIATPEGTELRSIVEGVVEKVVDYGDKSLGKGVMIRGEDGNLYTWGHMSEIDVSKGQEINFGEHLGFSGNTGHSTGAHLHFQVKDAQGEWIDPTPLHARLDAMTGSSANDGGLYIGEKAADGTLLDWFNDATGALVDTQLEWMFKPLIKLISEMMIAFGHWFVEVLPDLLGYGAIATGVFIIIGSMVGKGGMMRPLAYYVAAFIVGVCLLAG